MGPHDWTDTFGPFDEDGEAVALDDLDHPVAARGRPAHSSFWIHSTKGEEHGIEAAAFPIVASEEGASGAMIMFWPRRTARGS